MVEEEGDMAMKSWGLIAIRVTAMTGFVLSITAWPAMSADPKAGTSAPTTGAQTIAKDKETTGAPDFPVYRPPQRGAPTGRVGGGTRGTSARDSFVLSALAPNHMGLTMSDQPSLYWFISSSTALPVELAVADPRKIEPVIEARLPSPVAAGVHRIRLTDYGIRLEPGVAYRWSITVVPDANRRSRDILASGTIERVEPPAGLQDKLAQSPKERLPFLYAESGLWYDALAAASDLMENAPNEPAFRKQWGALLSQADLPEFEAAR